MPNEARELPAKYFHRDMNGARIPHAVNVGPQLTCSQCTLLRCGADFRFVGETVICRYCVEKMPASRFARMPTLEELARALDYALYEFDCPEGRVDAEQWAYALAEVPARWEIDAEDMRRAAHVFPQLSAKEWIRIAERANYLSKYVRFEAPRFLPV